MSGSTTVRIPYRLLKRIERINPDERVIWRRIESIVNIANMAMSEDTKINNREYMKAKNITPIREVI